MIPNWYFESPVALASPVLPLLPRTPLNPSTCALTMQSWHYRKTTKDRSIPVSCTANDVTLHWSFTPPKEQSAIEKFSWNRSLSRIPNTPDKKQKKFPRNGRRIGRELGPVPTLFKSKMAGQLAWCNNKCIISMQGFVWVIFFIKAKQAFCYPALLTVDGWFHFFSSKGLGKSQFTSILSLKLVYVCVIYVCMVMLLCWWVFKTTIQAITRSDEDYMLTNLLIS